MIIKVKKRSGELEPLDLEKLHKMTIEACENLTGVSASQVEMKSGLQFFDGISTSDIQQILVKSAADLISLDNPNYQYVAARLLLYGLRKEVFGQFDYIPLKDLIKKNIKLGLYDGEILNIYTNRELDKIDSFIRHERDLDFTYAGIKQVTDKYLVQDRSNGQIYETPQYMYALIAAWMFSAYPKDTRLDYVKRYYNALSTFKINIPTPVMSGVRTPIRQYASCVLVDSDDTLHSIFSSDMAIGYYTAQRAGIGINAGRIRGINSKIRGGEVQHTGIIPFLKKFEATVRSCTQNGVRGGSATTFFPIWHQEIEDILVLKNNKGSEDNRVRKLDYGIQISKLFYERYIKDKNISLFSPNNVPGLYRAFGHEHFDKMYAKYERDESIPRRTVKARELFASLLQERFETGRIYIMNIDHCNSHSSFTDPIFQSNLCVSGDTQILTNNGYVPIEEIVTQTVDVWNGKEWSNTTIVKTGENQELIEVTINDVETIKCTPYHKFYIVPGYGTKNVICKRAIELKSGDKLIKFDLPTTFGNDILEHAYSIGLHTGDGSYLKGKPIVDLYKHKREIIENLSIHRIYEFSGEDKTRVYLNIPDNTKFMVPNFSINLDSKLQWLAGYLDADGTIARNGTNESIQFASTNLEFFKDLKLMLQTIGVNPKISLSVPAGLQEMPNNKGGTQDYYCNTLYRLLIASVDTLHLRNLGLDKYLINRKFKFQSTPNRDARKYNVVKEIKLLEQKEDTYCFNEPIRHMGMFNGFLTGNCMEITLPTKPIQHIDDENGEIALCILSALNVGKITKLDDLEDLCDLAVRGLDELIDFQQYPVKSAEISTKARRSLGIGYVGLAYYLAKNKVKYDSPEAWKLVHDLSEAFQYHLLKASNQLAIEKGACSAFNRTKYFNGTLPIDTYKKEVDEVVPHKLNYNWDELRESIKTHGLRNSTLSAQMPSESSSVVCNTTNGIEPPRDFLSIKKSKKTPLKQIVPGYYHYRNYYTLLWDMTSNEGYMKVVAVMQKFFDQAISANWSYNPEQYPNNEVPISKLVQDMFLAYKLGHKTAYYCNVYDSKKDDMEDIKQNIPVEEIEQEAEDCDSCKI